MAIEINFGVCCWHVKCDCVFIVFLFLNWNKINKESFGDYFFVCLNFFKYFKIYSFISHKLKSSFGME